MVLGWPQLGLIELTPARGRNEKGHVGYDAAVPQILRCILITTSIADILHARLWCTQILVNMRIATIVHREFSALYCGIRASKGDAVYGNGYGLECWQEDGPWRKIQKSI